MLVEILYFGQLTELVSGASEMLEVNNETRLDQLGQILVQQYPALKNRKYRMAVNESFEEGSFLLNDGDQVAVLPPFAGG